MTASGFKAHSLDPLAYRGNLEALPGSPAESRCARQPPLQPPAAREQRLEVAKAPCSPPEWYLVLRAVRAVGVMEIGAHHQRAPLRVLRLGAAAGGGGNKSQHWPVGAYASSMTACSGRSGVACTAGSHQHAAPGWAAGAPW